MCRTNSQPSAPDADDVITADERIQKLRQRIRTIRNLKSHGRTPVAPRSNTKRLAACFITAVSNFYKER